MQLFPSVHVTLSVCMQLFPSVHVTLSVCMHWGVTILPLNAIVSQRACNSLSLHVLYLGPNIVKNIFCYFWLDVQINRGHPLTLISALGGHYTTIKCNCF